LERKQRKQKRPSRLCGGSTPHGKESDKPADVIQQINQTILDPKDRRKGSSVGRSGRAIFFSNEAYLIYMLRVILLHAYFLILSNTSKDIRKIIHKKDIRKLKLDTIYVLIVLYVSQDPRLLIWNGGSIKNFK
jgi:hypothetical protein